MTVLQRLQDAITKLEQLKAGSTPGPWAISDGWQAPGWINMTYTRVVAGEPNPISGIQHPIFSTNGAVPDSEGKQKMLTHADLVVTLHTMLPAVLGWMREQLARMERDVEAVTDESRAIHYRHVLLVVDAILDGEQ